MKSLVILALLATPVGAKPDANEGRRGPEDRGPIERRLFSNETEASTFLWNDWNKFVENYHSNYIADDDAKTAWVEGAPGSGAGQWVRVVVTPLEQTTQVRLKIRNGYQKSSTLFKANARAKDVTVRLLPSKTEAKITLTDAEGWQEVTVTQASGPLREVELHVGSVYEGSKYPDLCISDVQVFATSKVKDNPAFEKSKRADLKAWRAARIAAAKALTGKKVELPTYPAYAITKTEFEGTYADSLAAVIALAGADQPFAKEWKDALATAKAVAGDLDALPRAQLAPTNKQKLVAVDGMQITTLGNIGGDDRYNDESSLRLPMLGTVAALFSDQLRVLDVKDSLKVSEFEALTKKCKETVWVSRATAKEGTGPAAVRALVVGRCGMLEGREGSYMGHALQILVYDTNNRLVLLAGPGHVDGYRWTVENGKAMITGGRALLDQGTILEATKRSDVATAK